MLYTTKHSTHWTGASSRSQGARRHTANQLHTTKHHGIQHWTGASGSEGARRHAANQRLTVRAHTSSREPSMLSERAGRALKPMLSYGAGE